MAVIGDGIPAVRILLQPIDPDGMIVDESVRSLVSRNVSVVESRRWYNLRTQEVIVHAIEVVGSDWVEQRRLTIETEWDLV